MYAINDDFARKVGELLRAKPPENVTVIKYNGLWLDDIFEVLYAELWDLEKKEPPELKLETMLYLKRKKEWISEKEKEIGADFSIQLHSNELEYERESPNMRIFLIPFPLNKRMRETLEKFTYEFDKDKYTPRIRVDLTPKPMFCWYERYIPYHNVFVEIDYSPCYPDPKHACNGVNDLLRYLTRNYKRKVAEPKRV
ncbi:MAG: hypothetical protein QXZ02_06310 [Candidatus Bathyarchaeia archaeon]